MRKRIFLSIQLFVCFAAVRGQMDTLTQMRRFIRVCNVYKQLPVTLDVLVERRANLITSANDSSRTVAFFCLHSDASYVEMGGMEQLVNDSLLLLVNNPSKRMILYANHQAVADRFRQYMGLQVGDSSIRRMGRSYTASMAASTGDTALLEVKSRGLVSHTTLPKEEIRMRFHSNTDEPYEVEELQRSLVPVTRETYAKAGAEPGWAGKTVTAGDSLFFLVKEQTTLFSYRKISHDLQEKVPARVCDRIVAYRPGKYGPVVAFA